MTENTNLSTERLEEIKKMKSEEFLKELPEAVKSMDAARSGDAKTLPSEISLTEYVETRYGLTKEDYFKRIGINTKSNSMSLIFSMPNTDYRWLVPEIIREAITLGIKDAPFYPNIIAGDQPVNSLQVTMPYINPSDAAPAKLEEAETIPLGTVSFGQKSVGLFKIGKGMKVTDEVRNYVSLDVLSIYFRDFGVQLGYAMDNLAIDTLINGNKPEEAVGVVGVIDPLTGSPVTGKGITYRDLLKVWIRASRLGRSFQMMLSGEDQALDLLDLDEFKVRMSGNTQATLNLKTQIPSASDLYIHSNVADSSVLLVDPKAALIKLTAQQLKLESERIVSNQTSAMYASLTTGFSKMFQDASILIDGTEAFDGFPSYFNVDAFKNIQL